MIRCHMVIDCEAHKVMLSKNMLPLLNKAELFLASSCMLISS